MKIASRLKATVDCRNCVTTILARHSSATASRRILSMFGRYGEADYIGEPVSVISHCEQAAALASVKFPGDKEFIVSALLHDIGHVIGLEAGQKMEMMGCGVMNHEGLGADFLRNLGFSARIEKLVRSHVSAKRYLCYRDPTYLANLSEASRTTLGFQGGIMSAIEAAAFERDPDFEKCLLMRNFDEQAKIPNLNVPKLASYSAVLDQLAVPPCEGYQLSPAQLNFWKRNGYLKISNLLDFEQLLATDISNWIDDIAAWPKASDKWIQHWELKDLGTKEKIICRTENFVDYHADMDRLCRGSILSVASQLLEEPAVLFKEKVNYKMAGGAGFAAHQDTPAYIGLAKDHISAMIAVDAATKQNGCLELAGGRWGPGDVPLTESGVLTPAAEADMHFEPVECAAGEVLFFGGYTPHRSAANSSQSNRRALFLTYNPKSQGDHHATYYAAKHKGTQGFKSSHTISFQGDFQGVIVD